MRNVLVFIESNTTGTGYLLMELAAGQDVMPCVITRSPGLYQMPSCAEVLEAETLHEEDLLDLCRSIASTNRLLGITSTSEYFIHTSAWLAQKLQLPGPAPELVHLCRNKFRFREWQRKNGFTHPRFTLWNGTTGYDEQYFAGWRWPLVVKPIMGSGSVGVRLVSNWGDLLGHAEVLLQQAYNERGLPVPRQVLIEECIEGEEFSVELFDGEVIGITRKYKSPPPYFVECGHDFPAVIPGGRQNAVSGSVRKVIAGMGLDWGPVHVELMDDGAQTTIVEINPRLAGGFIPELIERTTGIDLLRAWYEKVIGRVPELSVRHEQYGSLRFLIPGNEGVLDYERDVDHKAPGEEICMYRSPGFTFTQNNDFRDRIGHVLTYGPEAMETAARAENIRDTVLGRLKFSHSYG